MEFLILEKMEDDNKLNKLQQLKVKTSSYEKEYYEIVKLQMITYFQMGRKEEALQIFKEAAYKS